MTLIFLYFDTVERVKINRMHVEEMYSGSLLDSLCLRICNQDKSIF